MSLKSIRENYTTLIKTFESAGVKLTESEKKNIDSFILNLESNIQKTKEDTRRVTRDLVEKKMEAKFRKVFESIMKHKAELDEISAKVQKKVTQIKESRKMADKVDQFLNEALEEAMPKKEIVNYKKLQKLETLVESMKNILVVNDDTISEKTAALEQEYDKKIKALNSKVDSLTKNLNESIKKEIQLKKRLDAAKAEKLLNEKLNDLPNFEARQVRRRLAGASVEEINKSFNQILESVHDEMDRNAKIEERSLKEEISSIIENADETSDKDKSDKVTKPAKDSKPVDEDKDEDAEGETEEVNEDTYDDVELDESEKIDSQIMAGWINRANSISPTSLNL